MKNKFFILVLVILLILIGVGVYLLLTMQEDSPEDSEQKQDKITVKEEFENKIVYEKNDELAVEDYKKDCEQRGGQFNECGSPCAPDAAVCAQVCAYTCNLEAEEQDLNLPEGWSMYENTDLGFAVAHPDQMNVSLIPNRPGVEFMLTGPDQEQGTELTDGVRLTVIKYDLEEAQTLEEFANERAQSTVSAGGEVVAPVQSVGQGQLEAYTFRVQNLGTYTHYVLEAVPGQAFDIGFTVLDAKQRGYANLLQGMLNSFQNLAMQMNGGQENGAGDEVTNFEECLEAGYTILESYPRKCETPSGEVFTEYIGNVNEVSDLIQLQNPTANASVESPLSVTGKAKGSWFFEGEFPVVLTDWDGKIITQSQAQAQGDWMTEDFVDFQVSLTFDAPDTEVSDRGTLILQKANPSGLPENDNALEIPVKFE